MDWVGLLEIMIILYILYAILAYSNREEKEGEAEALDFKSLMLWEIDMKLGPVEKTPRGLIKQDYVLNLQKIIVYFN